MKSLEGREVKILIDDFEIIGKIMETEGKFPVVSIGSSGYNIPVNFNEAYRAVYMGQIIRI